MSRVLRASILSLAVIGLLVSPAMASTATSFKGIFRETFGRGAAPTNIGIVHGLGFASESFTLVSSTPDDGCFIDVGNTVLGFADGDIYLQETNRVCPPGNSSAAPGSQVSFGNPAPWTGTYVITGGTGVFAGASGSGSTSGALAGDAVIIRYAGTLTLP